MTLADNLRAQGIKPPVTKSRTSEQRTEPLWKGPEDSVTITLTIYKRSSKEMNSG